MRKIALIFLDTFLDANFNFFVFLGRPGRDPGHDPSWVMTQFKNLGHDRDPVMTHNTSLVTLVTLGNVANAW